jgi:hypothetical protein
LAGRDADAERLLTEIEDGGTWPAFGAIAAEADRARR